MSLVDRARETAKKAGDAAQKRAGQAREKSQELTLRRRYNSLAADLGQIVFRQREGEVGLDAEVERLLDEMRGTKAELESRSA